MYCEVFCRDVSCVCIYKLVMIQGGLRSRSNAKISLRNTRLDRETFLRTQSYEAIRRPVRSPPIL